MIDNRREAVRLLMRKEKGLEPRVLKPEELKDGDPRIEPDWEKPCEVCGAVPTMPLTGMCGPCTFGEADTKDGNW